MKKYIYLAIACSWLSSGLALEDKFKQLKESMDYRLEQLAHLLSPEHIAAQDNQSLLTELQQKIAAILGEKIEDEKPFLSELFLEDAHKALLYAITDTCIQPGSGNTPLVERLTAIQKDLVVYIALLYDFLKKLEQIPLADAQKEQLHPDYLRALAKQAVSIRESINTILTTR